MDLYRLAIAHKDMDIDFDSYDSERGSTLSVRVAHNSPADQALWQCFTAREKVYAGTGGWLTEKHSSSDENIYTVLLETALKTPMI
jgi:hypothetical protein